MASTDKFSFANQSECRDDIDGVCMRKPAIKIITDELKVSSLNEAKKKTQCTSESCVITRVMPKTGNREYVILDLELKARFKPPGPRRNQWLSNYNIDDSLELWTHIYPRFYNCEFAMRDFNKYDSELSSINLKKLMSGQNKRKTNCDTMGVVCNTDAMSGGGKHWTVLFVDMRQTPITIEFFNSSGSPPCHSYSEWQHKMQAELLPTPSEIVIPNKIQHQLGRTECGVYSLYYIRARLEGKPWTWFDKERVTDAEMTEFRSYLFRQN